METASAAILMGMPGPIEPRRVTAQIVNVVFFDQVGYSLLSLEEQAESTEQLRKFILENPAYLEADAEQQVIPIDSGDGMAVVFLNDPQIAAEFALALRDFSGLRSKTPLRIGLNSGPVSLREDLAGKRNVSGAGIDVAQRVMSVAKPNEIMVSRGMAETLMSFDAWRPYLSEAGSYPVKHEQKLFLYRLGPDAGSAGGSEETASPRTTVGSALAKAIKEEIAPHLDFLRNLRAKVPTPMLEQFLRQAKPPGGRVWPTWVDIPLAILAGAMIMSLPLRGFAIFPAAIAVWGVLRICKSHRDRQIAKQTPQTRTAWERWQRIRRVVSIEKNNQLHSHVPTPVLQSLEKAARSWHAVTEDLRSHAISDPVFAGEAQAEVDAIMMTAVAAAVPVVRRDEHGRSRVKQMESDTALMDQICQQIAKESARLDECTGGALLREGSDQKLFERLAKSRRERAAAEAELNEFS